MSDPSHRCNKRLTSGYTTGLRYVNGNTSFKRKAALTA